MNDAIRDKIKADAKVRIRSGAVVVSDNPRRAVMTVKRPYWVRLKAVESGEVTWPGSAGYLCRTPVENVDLVEDLS